MQTATLSETAYTDAAKAKSTHPTELPPEYTCQMPTLWDQQTLATYLGKSTAWCERARWAGEGPRFVKLGRHVRYRAEDVLAWIDANQCTSTGKGGATA